MNENIKDEIYMKLACDFAETNVEKGGGPFGCIIVNEDCSKMVGIGTNEVTKYNDPTLHAEMVAIRNASRMLNTYDLSGCRLYTSCEPCPMCFGAIYWSRISNVFYGNTRVDAANIGFDDEAIYEEIAKPIEQRGVVKMTQICKEEAKSAFKKWAECENKQAY